MSKNYGTSTSGYLDPTNRNWETVVYEMGKPVLDKELNLNQDIDGGQAEGGLLNSMPSGWISDDFTGSSSPTSGIFISSATANTVQMPQGLRAHVNGWLLTIGNTNLINVNQLVLPAPPTGTGVMRTDIVILEVWRTLISASPSTAGKSASGRIWRYGNVKTDPSNDSSLNYVDDLLDTNVGQESTKRVQIQYRLRAVSGIDVMSYPYGMDDPTLLANSVPASAGAPDGVATAFTYTNQAANGDTGLWVAGDGNPANSLGTVDGLMYAIPLMGFFRRNSSGFNSLTNQNGGVNSPTTSDRPDGLNSNLIVARDVADLRLGVTPVGWNFPEVLDKNLTYIFDNALTTEWTTTSFGGGERGHTFLWSDQIGPTPTDGSGANIGNFDATRRRFSDRSIYEVMTVAIPMPGGGWASSSTTVSFTSLAVYPYSAFNWASFAPAGVVCYDIVSAHFIGGSGKKSADVKSHILTVIGLAAVPIANVTFTFDTLAGLGLTNETLYLDLLIAYPGGGLTKTATNTYGASSFVLDNPSSLPASAPINFSALANTTIDATHREAQLEYTTTSLTLTIAASTDTTGTAASITAKVGTSVTITGLNDRSSADIGKSLTISSASSGGNNGSFPITSILSPTSVVVTNASGVAPDANNGTIHWQVAGTTFRLPERAASVSAVLKNGVAIVGTVTLSADGRTATFTNTADNTSPGDTLQVTFVAVRPISQTGSSAARINVWYEARASQTGRFDGYTGGAITSLSVIPRYVSPYLYSITSGSGSEDTGYPFPNAYVQTGGIYNTSSGPTYSGEHELNARAAISIADFNATTGFLKLPTYVPYMPDPEAVTFTRAASADVDVEGRSFFKTVPGGYIPNAFATNLSDPTKHKVVLPMLAELASTSSYGHKGQLVLVLLIRWAVFDSVNAVFFDADLTQSTTTASVFRIKGNLLNKRNT